MSNLVVLTDRHWATLRALVDRIIPPDDFPGGWDAGVGAYLARQFEHDLRPCVAHYRAGLEALDAEALAASGTSFDALDPAAQDVLLARVEAGQVGARWPLDLRAFFRAAVEHTIEGFYSDPGNGGNRDQVAWHMIGFEVDR